MEGHTMKPIQKVMVIVDFSDASIRAAEVAASLAQAYGASLYVLQVKEPFPSHGRIGGGFFEAVQQKGTGDDATKLSEIIPTELTDRVPVRELKLIGTPAHRVILEKACELEVDVIVIASEPGRGWVGKLKKSHVDLVVRQAPCHVFVVTH